MSGLLDAGWQSADSDDAGRESYELSCDNWTLCARQDERWLCLTSRLDLTPDPDGKEYLSLLERSCSQYLVKHSLDEAGVPLLQLELPVSGLLRADCRRAGEAMQFALRHAGSGRQEATSSEHTPRWSEEEIPMMLPSSVQLAFRSVARNGWRLKPEPLRTDHWHAIYDSGERTFDLYLSFNTAWAYYQMPLWDLSGKQRHSRKLREFYVYVLQLNSQSYWAKFGIDDSEQVVLSLDMPLEMFDLPRSRHALETLATYASNSVTEIQVMADLDEDEGLAEVLSSASRT